MIMVSSRNIPEQIRVIHKPNCPHAKHILPRNRIRSDIEIKYVDPQYLCSLCTGLRGDFRTRKEEIRGWEDKYRMKIRYDTCSDTCFISTLHGFWKIYEHPATGEYLLYHRNYYDSEIPYDKAVHGSFHRQKDVKATDSLGKLVAYIAAHDRSKGIIKEDYRNLPKTSHKQKKYYKQAKNRIRREKVRKVEKIFSMLEQQEQRRNQICQSQ